ncbi:MAG: alanyl-tRNA synthetase [Chloroflexota bacterium]|nr:alanyl-tRNA synthetase [Chloroflexota bacterium]
MTDKRIPTSAAIRQQFLDFFASKGHVIVPSASLAPGDDPTLLFTNAGMNQFKEIFLGLREPAVRRVADAQKCMRVSGKHNDLEDVGRSPVHHPLFEMLGNWSFGDYYKKEAITWAWELLTSVWKLPKERLWATVFEDDKGDLGRDEEAAGYWRRETDINPAQVLYFGRKDNFWEMGDTGPCGPCSEINIDLGPDACNKQGVPDHVCRVNGDCKRYVELWNLVFIQYDHTRDDRLVPLPAQHVDTGMGFERIVGVLQKTKTNYDTDLFTPIIRRTQALLGHTDAERDARALSYRVIADHSRSITFLIGDGVLPGNEGRGYVLRLILRRAARHGRMLGFTGPFLAELAKTVIETMGAHYGDLVRRREFILSNIAQEETRFSQTLTVGMERLGELIAELKTQGQTVIPGDEAFRLYDTYGFPLDLTHDEARDHGMTVDPDGYEAAMAEQRERARSAAQFGAAETQDVQVYLDLLHDLKSDGLLSPAGVTHSYDETVETETTLAALLRDGKSAQGVRTGDKVEVVLPETPFYLESGGQVSDLGYIGRYVEGQEEPVWEIRIDAVRRPVPGLIVHVGETLIGTPAVGDPVSALVDEERRWDIMRNHTATHLLHSELRYVLGEHVHQAGSVVEPDHLRFDFTHSAMLSQAELDAVEQSVNDAVLADYPVLTSHASYHDAISAGAMALFTEKYGADVRVVKVGWEGEEFSKELCGGTHVLRTGQIGFFHIVSEASVGAGVRRIEAVTGRGAMELVQSRLRLLDHTAAVLRVPPDQLDRAVRNLYVELQALQKEGVRLRAKLAFQQTEQLAAQAVMVKGIAVVAAQVEGADVQTLRDMSDWLRNKLGSAVVILAAAVDDKPQIIAAVTDDLVKRGVHAGELVKNVARVVGGGGGGKPSLAQAGGRDLSKLAEALAQAPELVAQAVSEPAARSKESGAKKAKGGA